MVHVDHNIWYLHRCVFLRVALPVRRRQAEGDENAVWETIQQAISSNAKTARFLVIIAGRIDGGETLCRYSA